MNSSDLFRQFLDAGMQFSQLTQRRAEAIVKDLVKTGEVQAEQAQATVAEFVERSRLNSEKFFEQVRAEIRQQLKVLGVATKADLAKVEKRAAGAGASATSTASTAKKTTAKKTTATKSTPKKSTAKKSTAKKSTAKRSTAKKTAATTKAPVAPPVALDADAPFTRTPSADAT
jgi:polyhydroxyalkanoate synthesis regulator phasin